MGERKVLNKYIPADFDPSLVPRGTKLSKKDGTVPVRMMLPFSVQCSTCHTFMYRGRKFNSKKEAMGGPDGRYLGIQRWRFYIKCTHCSRTISFLTDPKNADYEMESGGTRNYEVYKDKAKTEEKSAIDKEEEEKEDPMKALENRVLDSQREMADLDNLEEIKAMNQRHLKLMGAAGDNFGADAEALLNAREEAKEKRKLESSIIEELNEHGTTADEENLIKSIKFGQTNNGGVVRLNEEDEKREEARRKKELELIQQRQQKKEEEIRKATQDSKPIVPKIKVKRKKIISKDQSVKKAKVEPAKPVSVPAPEKPNAGGGLAGLLGDYGSSSDSD